MPSEIWEFLLENLLIITAKTGKTWEQEYMKGNMLNLLLMSTVVCQNEEDNNSMVKPYCH